MPAIVARNISAETHRARRVRARQHGRSNNNQNPRVFLWSASVERILTKVAECKEALDALH